MSAARSGMLVGSIPLCNAEEVIKTAAASLGDRLRRIPDGETGPRTDRIVRQYPVLNARPRAGPMRRAIFTVRAAAV